ncbi:MAG TPA: hypothetical protein VFE47_12680 [Tepidisphaeraceae bacterium]|jgi:hypothetical protein|nr:hypothetical protein [Tepidisphaeraceae bacterium]
MGTTFVSVGENGFWVRDGLLELWLRLASLHIEDPLESGGLATKIRDQWLIASRGYFNGHVPIAIGEDISTAEGKQLVRDAIQSLQQRLKAAPASLGGAALNLLGMEGQFGSDIETLRLIEVGQAFLDLVDGKVQTTAKDDARMPGD